MIGSEIITLQLGHFASHVGTHFWNLQEANFCYDQSTNDSRDNDRLDACHDILFREGVNRQGQVTFTPRLVIVDRKGSLGSVKADGKLYEDAAQSAEQDVLWDSCVSLHKSEPVAKSRFQAEAFGDEEEDENEKAVELDGESKDAPDAVCQSAKQKSTPSSKPVRESFSVWSDFLGLYLHPRSVALTPNYWHAAEEKQFMQWQLGRELWQNAEFSDDLETRIRLFAEECDLMQGVHAMYDAHDAFGGLAMAICSYLREEFPKKVIIGVPCFPPNSENITTVQSATYQLNWLLSAVAEDTLTDLAVPLSTSHTPWVRKQQQAACERNYFPLKPQLSLAYHSSCVLASWLDTQSLTWRQLAGPRLWDVQQLLCCEQRRLCTPSLRLPFQLLPDASLYASLNADSSLHSVGAFQQLQDNSPGEFISALSVSRGLPQSRIVNAKLEREAAFLLREQKVSGVFSKLLDDLRPGAVSKHVAFDSAVALKAPFPEIFDARVSAPFGELVNSSNDQPHLPTSVAAWSLLENSSRPAEGLGQLSELCQRQLRSGQFRAAAGAIEAEEVQEALHSLSDMRDRFQIAL